MKHPPPAQAHRAVRNRHVRARISAVAVVTIFTALSFAAVAAPAQAVPADMATAVVAGASDSDRGTDDGLTAEVLAAMQRDLGLTEQQARQRVSQQTRAMQVERTVRDTLGPSFGGSWFDASSGQLVVGVTSAQDAAKVTALGAQPRIVARGFDQMQAIAADLDRLAGKAPAKAGTRAASGKPQAAVAGLIGWHVDPQLNSVVVSAVKGQQLSNATLANLARYGSAVRMEYLPAAPTLAYDYMDGADTINLPGGSCSAGFNLRNPSTGQRYLLIVGHCVQAGQTVTGQGGITFGVVQQSFFPTWDDAIIQTTNFYWVQGPWVDINPSNGTVLVITGFTDASVGTAVCKSGITTKLTCGYITAKHETINFPQGTVYGETRHSACAEPGDSGGSNFMLGSTYTAEGVTSAVVLYSGRCGSAVGQPNVSWYFPFANSISYYGPAYGVSLWQP